MITGNAYAADGPAPASQPLELITVTASRISRAGYETPTPTTVLDFDELTLRAPLTLADALSLLPQMRNAAADGTGSLMFGGAAGRGFVNLRGLGTNRTLVLLDGERPVGNTLSGDRDITSLPSALISRVDVVTGGASASYGSDAIAGVVNFLIDSRFSGFKARVEGGVSSQSDAAAQKLSAAWGGDFGERWHLVASAEGYDRDGLSADSRSFSTPPATVLNPSYTLTNGQRPLLVVRNAYDAQQAPGGLILSGPLSGQHFLPDGTTAPYVPSSCTLSDPYVLCDSRQNLASTLGTIALTAPQRRAAGFARLTFQMTPDLEARFDTLLARSETSITSIPLETSVFGLRLGIDVAENPFLPEAVRSQYLSAGESTLFVGRQNTDEGIFADLVRESVESFSTGLRGRLAERWTFNAHASYGEADTGESWQNAYSIDRFFNAVDAVNANGTIACRINAVAVADAACAPADIFGSGNMSAEAKAYFLGTIYKPLKTYQRELAMDVAAEPLSVSAGSVSVALGASYREEEAQQFTSAADGEFAFTGYPAFSGATRVTEAYAQAVVPLFRDEAFAKSMELDLAARSVRYSQAGSELPWKLGVNWVPHDSVRLRFTASEDIRAPNILELYLPQFQSSISPQVNPLPDGLPIFNSLGFAPGATLNVREIGGGNLALTPEVARTTAVGAVFRPARLAGFTASLDHFRIEVDDAITTLPASAILLGCAAGDQDQCGLIGMPASSTLPVVATIPVNAQSFVASGLDAEATYTFRLGGGEATIRALANYLHEYEQIAAGAPTQDLRGDNRLGLPALQGDLSFRFTRGRTTALLSGVYIGSGSYRKNMAANIQNNDVPHVWYVDFGIDHSFRFRGADWSAYAAVSNVLDEEPPHPGFGIYTTIESSFFTGVPYDRVGRYFKIGLRIAL
jgi:outer membrane receptor protein involved in Fe transport